MIESPNKFAIVHFESFLKKINEIQISLVELLENDQNGLQIIPNNLKNFQNDLEEECLICC